MYKIFEQLLNEQNLTAYKVSKETGVTQTALSNWKTGKSTPNTKTLQKLADYFGVTVDYLINGDEKEWQPTLSEKEHIDIGRDVQATLDALDSKTGLMFDGEILDEETKEYLESALKTAFTNAKIMAKEKYTPKKYRK